MQKAILIYLIFINIAAFVVYTFDKYRARVNARRISENRLHQLSLLGGFVGASLSMFIFRHKIKKISFMLTHIFIILLWMAGIFYYFNYVDEMNFLDMKNSDITIIKSPINN